MGCATRRRWPGLARVQARNDESRRRVNRTRDLPVFPLTPDPVRPDVSPDVAPVRHELVAAGSLDGPRIALITLGCDKNTVDSERMMAVLLGHGAHVSSDVDGSDVVIVNTCGFIQQAKEESIETILEGLAISRSAGTWRRWSSWGAWSSATSEISRKISPRSISSWA